MTILDKLDLTLRLDREQYDEATRAKNSGGCCSCGCTSVANSATTGSAPACSCCSKAPTPPAREVRSR